MSALIIIFIVISSIFAVSSLGYVAYDVVLEVQETRRARAAANTAPVIVPPIVEPVEIAGETVEEVIEEIEEEEEMPEIVEHIDADEADAMLSDTLAMSTVVYESGAGHGKQGIINIGAIDAAFEAGDVVTLAAIKQKGLVPKSIGRIKILADGALNKPLTVKAEAYSVQAIKMIELTGGTVVILKA